MAGQSPRDVLEQLVVNDQVAWWRLRLRTEPLHVVEEAWQTGVSEPGTWRLSTLAAVIREVQRGDVELTPELVEEWSWFLETLQLELDRVAA